ncbi:hypothetical protein RRG08_041405 [Elysia crispata]|uniref:Uncharacterized protein n=1 Tax=Elysia crispata TaxID=231223 RepID=A0AAE0XRG2_9GAST|nr:hypothetical protein RRG08_041405 [Elysia crispata]
MTFNTPVAALSSRAYSPRSKRPAKNEDKHHEKRKACHARAQPGLDSELEIDAGLDLVPNLDKYINLEEKTYS